MLHSSTDEVKKTAIAERIVAERLRLGMTQAQLADAGGVSKRSQISYEQDRHPAADYLSAVAEAGVDVLYVLTGQTTGDRRATQAADALHNLDDYASIPVHDAFLAAGPAAQNDIEGVIGYLAFRRDWLARIGVPVEKARLARVAGDSMVPTMSPGDMLLIDTGITTPPIRARDPADRRRSAIYALVDGDGARVKRIDRPNAETVVLTSDNPAHPPEIRTGREIESLRIIGRVAWWGHTVRS